MGDRNVTETLQAPEPAHRPQASPNVRHLSRMELPGGGQITIQGNFAYVGHQNGPEGTTILDISDPRKPKIVSRLMTPNFVTHTHKVRVVDDLMFTNSEYQPGTARAKFDDPGFCIYNVKDKTNPKLVKFMRTHGKGVHRFDLDEHLRLYLDRGRGLRRQHPGHLRHPRSVEPDRGRAAGG